jgi:hypothetical protein
MKTIFAAIALILLLSASLGGWRLLTPAGVYVIGGVYVIPRGQVIQGDLHVLFAQVIVEDGARLDGRIVSISSTLDLAGGVAGEVLAIGSDTTIRDSAKLLRSPHEVRLIPYVILLPSMARVGSLPATPQ